MTRRVPRERQISTMTRAQLLDIVRNPLAPAKDAWLAYHRLEGLES